MERLTYFDGGKWRLKIGDTEYSGEAVDRLAAYEETGLEPCDYSAMAHALEQAERAREDLTEMIRQIGATGLDRLRELAQADKEGRCVVAPAGGFMDTDGENALKSAMNTCFYHNNPVTRYIADAVDEKLTRAEAALRREQDG